MLQAFKLGCQPQMPSFMHYQLGQVVAPGAVVQRLQKVVGEILQKLAEQAAQKETKLILTGNALAAMALKGVAKYSELVEYNLAAWRLHSININFYNLLKEHGVQNIPPVPLPKLFREVVSGPAKVTILAFTRAPKGTEVPFREGFTTYPSTFIQADEMVDPVTRQPVKVSGHSFIGVAPLVAVWALRIVWTIVGSIALIFVVKALNELLNGAALIQQRYNEWAGAQHLKEVEAVTACVANAIEAQKAAGLPVPPWTELRAECDKSIAARKPRDIGKPETASLGKTALYIGLAVAIVFVALSL